MNFTPALTQSSTTKALQYPVPTISFLPNHVSQFNKDKETKVRADESKAAYGYKKATLNSIADFSQIIESGATWSNPVYKNGHRNQVNVIEATTLSVEFDDVIEGTNDWQSVAPNSRAFAAIPSPSHFTGNLKHDKGGYRLVYRLNRKVNGGELKALVAETMLSLKFDDASVDESCKDVARFWFGAKGAELLYSSIGNWNNPLDVDQLLSDRAVRLGIGLSPEMARFLSGCDDGVVNLSHQADFYHLYSVAVPKEWAKTARHEALRGIQDSLTTLGLDELAVQIRQSVRGDSEGEAESRRQVQDTKQFRESTGKPFEFPAVPNFQSNSESSYQWQGKKSNFLGELEYYEPTPESKSVFDWSKVKQTLPSDIRHALESQHEILGTPFHALVLSALTTLSTDLSGKAVVSVNPASDWFEGLNLWAAIVGVPGSAKSPFLGQFGKPLAILENKYTQEFKDRAKQHEIAKCEYEMNKKDMIAAGEILEELKPKRFASFGQTTTEKLITSIASNRLEHSTGFLIFLDELTGLLGAFNKRGGSDDAAVFLSSWVGGEMKKATGAGGEIFTAKSNCSILGGIQDNVWTKYLKLIAGGSDDNGFAGRWLISYLSIENITRVVIGSKSEPSRLPSVIEHYLFKFADLNDGIILHLEEDSAGQKVIDNFDAIIKTSNNPNVWIKGKSNVFRIAGLLAMLKDKRTVSTLDIEAACIIVLESIRFHEKLNGSSDEKAVSTIVDKAKAIGIKRGRLDNRTLTMAKLCESTEERQQIILKLHEEFGGTLEDARKGLKVWIPV